MFKDKTICFHIEPADDEAIEILGNFYCYGGVGCCELELVNRE